MKIVGLSASSYDKYDFCPFSYFLSYTCRFEDQVGAAAILGTMAHTVLEILSRASIVKHDKSSKIWDTAYLWKIAFDHVTNDNPIAAADITDDKVKKVCNGLIKLIASDYSPIRDNTIGVEIPFKVSIQKPGFEIPKEFFDNYDIPEEEKYNKFLTLRGFIDRIDKLNDDTIEIIDYKSGSSKNWDSPTKEQKNSLDLNKMIQPRIYHLAAKELYPNIKNFIVTFHYFTEAGPISYAASDSDIPETLDKIRRRFSTIKNDWTPVRNKSWKCNRMCSYGKYGECDYVYNELQKLGFEFIENKYSILNERKKGR